MGEAMDQMSSQAKLNVVMPSEDVATGAVHGAWTARCLSSTFTAPQGLLIMIPNMYLIAGRLIPCVMHVSVMHMHVFGRYVYRMIIVM